MGHGICDNVAKSMTLACVTDDASVISKECVQLLRSLHVPAEDMRGVRLCARRRHDRGTFMCPLQTCEGYVFVSAADMRGERSCVRRRHARGTFTYFHVYLHLVCMCYWLWLTFYYPSCMFADGNSSK